MQYILLRSDGSCNRRLEKYSLYVQNGDGRMTQLSELSGRRFGFIYRSLLRIGLIENAMNMSKVQLSKGSVGATR